MIGVIITGLIGAVLAVFGVLIWKKEKIALLHDYHYAKVPEADRKAFCALSGIGMLSIGIGLLLTAAVLAATDSAWSFLACAAGFAIGLIMLIHADRKYNQ